MMNELAALVEERAKSLPELSFAHDHKESVTLGNMTIRFNPDQQAALALVAKLRKKKKVGTTQRKLPLHKHKCFGGPYHGHDIYLTRIQPHTMVFTASGTTGRYVPTGNKNEVFWEEVK